MLYLKLLEFSTGTYVDGIVDLWHTFWDVLYFYVNVIIAFLHFHKAVYTSMVPFHKLNIIIIIFKKVRLKIFVCVLLCRKTRFWNLLTFINLSQEIFYIRPSDAVCTFNELNSLATLFKVNINVHNTLFEHL